MNKAVTVYTRWKKIDGRVYLFRSFDKKNWEKILTPLKRLPYAPIPPFKGYSQNYTEEKK